MSEIAMSEIPAVSGRVSESDYLAALEASEVRLEFISGRIVAMTGASKHHNTAALNLAILLRTAAKPSGCATYIEGVRLRIDEQTHVFPDVMVVCDDSSDTHSVTNPCLVAEVLSPSTAWFDQNTKRTAYLQIDSLRHYLLINLKNRVVEHFSRPDSTHLWTYQLHDEQSILELHCPETILSVAEIFAGLPAEPAEPLQ
jgi:Uma2 family endonuclease